MRHARTRALAATPVLFVLAACASAPSTDFATSYGEPIAGTDIISRGGQWVSAGLHYCQAARGAVDGDSSCWGWEGSSHRCNRQSNSAWDAYRSDCSGFVTWSWGLPPVGDGGYVTSDFAPYGTSFSHTIPGSQLQPGDALNKTPSGHIVLFERWLTPGQTAVFMEEPGCSSSRPYAHEFTSNVSISGSTVHIDYEGADFYAIRFAGLSGGGGGSSGGSGGGSGSGGGGGGGGTPPLVGHYVCNTSTSAVVTQPPIGNDDGNGNADITISDSGGGTLTADITGSAGVSCSLHLHANGNSATLVPGEDCAANGTLIAGVTGGNVSLSGNQLQAAIDFGLSGSYSGTPVVGTGHEDATCTKH